ncbi:MAG: cytochrome P450, partial [Bryobacterales bacterium]|nr:cytochrome P450 [Bryobacterales bacterium]
MNQPPVASLGPDFPLRPGLALASAYERHGPVFRIESPGSFVYMLVGPEANRLVLGTERAKFSNEQGWQRLQRGVDLYGRGLTFLDGEEHTTHRNLMSPSFRIDQVEAYQPAVRRALSRATNHWEQGKQVSLYETFFRITFETAAESFLGVTSEPEVTALMEAFQVLEVLQRVRVPQSHHLAAEQGAIR